MQNMLIKLVLHSMSKYTNQVNCLAKSLINFVPANFHSLCTTQSESANRANLVNS